jgi:mRNA interferase RelE/StbE
VREIITTPNLGKIKKGDLEGIRVYKFRMINEEYLLAYVAAENQITLLSMGCHENFYRDLKKNL